MPTPRYYSPRIERELVSRLYFAAKAEGIPMTRFASRLLRERLDAREVDSATIREAAGWNVSKSLLCRDAVTLKIQ